MDFFGYFMMMFMLLGFHNVHVPLKKIDKMTNAHMHRNVWYINLIGCSYKMFLYFNIHKTLALSSRAYQTVSWKSGRPECVARMVLLFANAIQE